eukprot:6203163-Pleurochrysis_carterae.AAC.3
MGFAAAEPKRMWQQFFSPAQFGMFSGTPSIMYMSVSTQRAMADSYAHTLTLTRSLSHDHLLACTVTCLLRACSPTRSPAPPPIRQSRQDVHVQSNGCAPCGERMWALQRCADPEMAETLSQLVLACLGLCCSLSLGRAQPI